MTTASVNVRENLRMRLVTMGDVERVVEFLNICSVADLGVPEYDVETLRNEWTAPGLNIEESMRLVETAKGQIVGFAEVSDLAPIPARIWTFARTHPEYESLGIGTQLTDWIEERARQAVARVPEEYRVVMLAETLSSKTAARAFLEERGMRYIRTFWQMRIDMDAEPPVPQWPEGITLKPFVRDQDLIPTIQARREIWRDHWGFIEQPLESDIEQWSHLVDHDPIFDPSLWFLAVDGDEIVGLSLCWPKSDDDPDTGWVGILGVKRHWRRKGLALALLHHSFGEFWRRGKRAVGLGVDAANPTGATHLYEKAGMRPFREWTAYELELRPGREIMTIGQETN